jgi:O-antigen ligase
MDSHTGMQSFSFKIEKIIYFMTIGVAVTFPYSIWINNLFSILLIAAWLMQFKWPIKNSILIIFIAYFLIHIVGLLYTNNMSQGFFELEKKLSFIIFPIALSGRPQFTKDQFNTILASFAASCSLASLLCVAMAVYKWLLYDTTKYFFYYDLVDILDIHPIYFSMYICFSCFILTYFYFQTSIFKTVASKLFLIAGLLYLMIFIFLTSARAEILAFSIILFSGVLVFFFRRKQLLLAVGIIFIFLIFFAGLIFLNPTNADRFKEAINYNSEYSIDKQWGGRALRLLKWNCSIEVIRQNLFFGVGTGDAQDELQKCYEIKKYSPLLYWPETKFNAHNQYLQSGIDFGLIGFVIIFLLIAAPVYHSLKTKNYLFLSFITLFALCCVTESMLEANKGIMFFTFFTSFFMIVKEN